MSTNSALYLYKPEGDKFKELYGHWDGYYAWTGLYLIWKYRNLQDVLRLFSYGNVSSYGAPLWNIGITPQESNNKMMSTVKMECFTQHYCNEPVIEVDGKKVREHMEKIFGYYEYYYFNNWWYVSKKENGKLVLVPVTYKLCEYLPNSSSGGNLCTIDIVVRNAETQRVFTYDYFTLNAAKYGHQRKCVEGPAVRIINRVAKELCMACANENYSYNNMLQKIGKAILVVNKSNKDVIKLSNKISELPQLKINNEDITYICQKDYDGTHYSILQGNMPIVSNMWSAGVQILCDISENKTTCKLYCRINIPEFENVNEQLLNLLGITEKDIVTIDGLRWVKYTNKLWTQAQYTQFINACDEIIKKNHPVIAIK